MEPIRTLTFAADRPLGPGRYRHAGFEPALSFAVGDGWSAVQDVPGFFDIERGAGSADVVAVQFARPAAYREVAQLVADIRGRRELFSGSKTPIEVDGAPGIQIVVDPADPALAADRFVPVFDIGMGPISIAAGRRLELNVVERPDGLVAVLVGGPARGWAAAQAAARPVIESIRFERDATDDH